MTTDGKSTKSGLVPISSGTLLLLALATALVALATLSAAGTEMLAYRRSTGFGQPWRWLSAHFVHLGWRHTLMNAAALGLLAALVGRLASPRYWGAIYIVGSLVISLALWLFEPGLERYVGASGVLHAIAAAGGVLLFTSQKLEGLLLSGGVAAKIIWELLAGANSATASWIGGNIIFEAHVAGALFGFASGFGLVWLRRRRKL